MALLILAQGLAIVWLSTGHGRDGLGDAKVVAETIVSAEAASCPTAEAVTLGTETIEANKQADDSELLPLQARQLVQALGSVEEALIWMLETMERSQHNNEFWREQYQAYRFGMTAEEGLEKLHEYEEVTQNSCLTLPQKVDRDVCHTSYDPKLVENARRYLVLQYDWGRLQGGRLPFLFQNLEEGHDLRTGTEL